MRRRRGERLRVGGSWRFEGRAREGRGKIRFAWYSLFLFSFPKPIPPFLYSNLCNSVLFKKNKFPGLYLFTYNNNNYYYFVFEAMGTPLFLPPLRLVTPSAPSARSPTLVKNRRPLFPLSFSRKSKTRKQEKEITLITVGIIWNLFILLTPGEGGEEIPSSLDGNRGENRNWALYIALGFRGGGVPWPHSQMLMGIRWTISTKLGGRGGIFLGSNSRIYPTTPPP